MIHIYDLEISNLVIRIESAKEMEFTDCFLPFLKACDSSGKPDICIEISYYENCAEISEFKSDENVIIQRFDLFNGEYLYRIEYKTRKDICRLFVPYTFAEKFCNKVNLLLYMEMERLLLPFNRVFLHASAVIYDGKAYVFSAPSGVGKSTHAELWEKYYDAEIINGDKIILEIDGNRCRAYGGPVAGSSSIYKNKGADVAGIVFLSQGKKNKVTDKEKRKGYFALYSGMIKSTWDEQYNSSLLEYVGKIVETTNIMFLECTADKEAVECIKNHLERILYE